MSDMEQSLLTRKEAATLLGIPESLLADTARRKRGGPPHYKFTQRTILYDRKELLHWYASVRVAPAGRVSADVRCSTGIQIDQAGIASKRNS